MVYVAYETNLPKNVFWKKSEILDKYGPSYELFIKDSLLVKDREFFRKYKEDDKVVINTINGEVSISKKLLLDLLTNEGMYKYLLNNITNNHGNVVNISYFLAGKIYDSIIIKRSELLLLYEKLDDNLLSDLAKIRIVMIRSTTSTHSCKKRYSERYHETEIDGKKYCVQASILLDLLTMPESEFLEFVSGSAKYPYDKEHMAYLVVDFVERERIFEEYALPEEMLLRYQNLRSYKDIDFEVLNKYGKTNDEDGLGESIVHKCYLNSELESAIWSSCPEEYDNLERALYAYIRMCDILTYDQEFFSTNGHDGIALQHDDLERIMRITPKNNSVIHTEFVTIFSKILSELGIQYTVDYNRMGSYSEGYSWIKFRYAEYLVTADPLKNVIMNDMSRMKMGEPLVGLKSNNNNKVTNDKFLEKFYKVYSNYMRIKNQEEHIQDILSAYRMMHEAEDFSLSDKLCIFFKNVSESPFLGVDALAYQQKIFDMLFKNEKISLHFISSNVNSYKGYAYTPVSVISLSDGIKYYLIDVNNPQVISPISKGELTNMFEIGYYAYINKDDKIPGINLSEEKNYVR